MQAVATASTRLRQRRLPAIPPQPLAIWALTAGIVLYLGIDGGGYDLVVHSQLAIVVWWLVLVGSAWGLLPAARLSRVAWGALGLLGGFVAWTALGCTWSLSAERSIDDLALVAGYLGVLVAGLALHTDRAAALRHTIAAVASSIVVIAGLALAARLHPGLFPAAQQTATYLPDSQQRLGWPLNYWNALGALVALGLPLLLSIATTARRLAVRSLAAAALPALALCGYLTFSRGGAITDGVAVVAFYLLTGQRIPKLATGIVAAAGSAALIAGAAHRTAIENGATGSAASHQGATLLWALLLVCAGVAVLQAAITLADRHGTPPRRLAVSPTRARWLLAAGIVAVLIAAGAVNLPGRISHAWDSFKHPTAAALGQSSLARFGTLSGNGRYDYWRTTLNATTGSHLLHGWGPGTFQLVWLPRAPYGSYVVNAHSLYVETVVETGIVGIVLLGGFLVLVLITGVARVVRSRDEQRGLAAGAAAALLAFCVSAAADWFWQVPVLPAAFMLLAAAVLAPRARHGRALRPAGAIAMRAGAAILAVACLIAIAVPLATTTAVRASQSAAAAGQTATALADARQAVRVNPDAASAQLQLALVLESAGQLRPALAAAHHAVSDEPTGWTEWLTVSRLEAEAGHPGAALAAYRRAKALNPKSSLFS